MNIVYITQEIFLSFIKKAETYTQLTGLKNLLRAFLWKTDVKGWLLNFKSYDYKLGFKSATFYLFNASVEGIKQNLFGPDVSLEFVVLTVRAWLILTAGFVVGAAGYITGRSAKKRNNKVKCPDYYYRGDRFKLCLQ
jgi:hypothetical protein